jgi:NADPH-dependent curcumin reductase CurA
LKINPKIAPIQSFLGVLGMTGLTAYVGLLKIGKLNEGKDTVFISSYRRRLVTFRLLT